MNTAPLFLALLLTLVSPTQAETIAIIGTGNVAKALGPEFASLGPYHCLRIEIAGWRECANPVGGNTG